ncbi:TPR end-of-group domain-containing protein [Flexithrix dorotheae]|uniref:TPR end-of-group domain-containing protein n=1 Tax=Flexithrix dorotheae TaxID=70993 RepID=UPI000363CF8A|nr:hypothetical protein [Flexithrix dorotheae]
MLSLRQILVGIILYFHFSGLHAQENIKDFTTLYGTVIDSVKCKNNPTQSYALFLPKTYSPDRSWPVIYFFEPAARGALPLNKYYEIAEKFNFIFVCSNNSKNGSWETVFDAADAIFMDTQERFNIDKNRIYTSGFSGGSRAAVTLIHNYPNIRGVIGCGAGFSINPAHHPTKAHSNLRYVGIVGNRDMNYLEQFRVAEALNKLGIPNFLITFEGKHEWPPVANFYQAIEWLVFQEQLMRTTSVSKNDINTDYYFNKRTEALTTLNQNEIIAQTRIYQALINDFYGIYNMESFAKRLEKLQNSKTYKKKEKEIRRLNSRELAEREKYLQALAQIPYNNLIDNDSIQYWWKMERNALFRMENSKDSLKSRMASRLLNLIWATCAEKGWGALQKEDFIHASNYFYLWTEIQKDSYWPYLNLACSYSLQNNKQEAIKMLKKATDLDELSPSTLEKIQALNNIRKEPEYIEILSKLPKE